MTRLLAFALCLGACGHPSAPHGPAAAVKTEVELAEDAEKARKHDEARIHYEAAIAAAKDPANLAFAHREFGETLVTWGEIALAQHHFEAAIAARPDDAIAWEAVGLIRHHAGDIAGAFAALERSKQLAPRSYIPRRDLAVLHWSLGEGRTADPDPHVAATHRAAALAEYKAMLDLELPDRVREKIHWAIGVLSKPAQPAPADRPAS